MPALPLMVRNEQAPLMFEPVVDLATGCPIVMQVLTPRESTQAYGLASTAAPRERQARMMEVDAGVLESACWELKRWTEAGLEMRVCVPVHALTLSDAGLPAQVDRLARVTGIALSQLEFGYAADEHSEAAVGYWYPAMPIAATLVEMGCTLCLSGFGGGYNSLATLKRLPCSRVEVHDSFNVGEGENGGDIAILQATQGLLRSFGLHMTVAGVGTQHPIRLLEEIGVDSVRGPAFGGSMTPATAQSWLVGARERIDARRAKRTKLKK